MKKAAMRSGKALGALALGFALAASSLAGTAAAASCDAASFAHLVGSTELIPGAQITNIDVKLLKNEKIAAQPPYFPTTGHVSACQLEATHVYPGTNSTNVRTTVWLPPTAEAWNGRFLGNGGGGWQCSMGLPSLVPSIEAGFATATTDGGIDGSPFAVDWTLLAPGNPNAHNLERLGHRAIHDMTLFAKQAVKEYYGRAAQANYYVGCSTGGRQGFMEASRYPEDYDGLLLGAPAVRWNDMVIKSMADTVAMHRLNYFPSECEIRAMTDAAVEACDSLDGRTDGIIMRPDLCKFPAQAAIGRPYNDYCDGKGEVRRVTDKAARFMQQAIDGHVSSSGKRLGPGFPWGTNLTFGVASTARTMLDTSTGRRTSDPFALSKQWVEDYLWHGLQKVDFDKITYDDLEELQRQSDSMYAWTMEPYSDLSCARDRGAKIIMYHGTEDAIIPVGNSLMKYDDVRRTMYPRIRTDAKALDAMQSFFRLYLVPGMAHCRPHPEKHGRVPFAGGGALRQLMQWVEAGQAPEELATDGISQEDASALGKLCRWPKVPYWINKGTTLECRDESILTHLKSQLPSLRDLPIMYMEKLPRWLFLTTTDKDYTEQKNKKKASKAEL